MTPEQLARFMKWLMGGLAVVAAFLLAQPDLALEPVLKVALGAFIAFAAYVDPTALAARIKG